MSVELFCLNAEELKLLDEMSFLDDKFKCLSSSDTSSLSDIFELSFDIAHLRCELCRALVSHYKKFNNKV